MMRKGLSEESKIAKQQGFIIMPITFPPFPDFSPKSSEIPVPDV